MEGIWLHLPSPQCCFSAVAAPLLCKTLVCTTPIIPTIWPFPFAAEALRQQSWLQHQCIKHWKTLYWLQGRREKNNTANNTITTQIQEYILVAQVSTKHISLLFALVMHRTHSHTCSQKAKFRGKGPSPQPPHPSSYDIVNRQ